MPFAQNRTGGAADCCAPCSVVRLWTRLWVIEHPSGAARSVPLQYTPETHGYPTQHKSSVCHMTLELILITQATVALALFLRRIGTTQQVEWRQYSNAATQFPRSHRRPAS